MALVGFAGLFLHTVSEHNRSHHECLLKRHALRAERLDGASHHPSLQYTGCKGSWEDGAGTNRTVNRPQRPATDHYPSSTTTEAAITASATVWAPPAKRARLQPYATEENDAGNDIWSPLCTLRTILSWDSPPTWLGVKLPRSHSVIAPTISDSSQQTHFLGDVRSYFATTTA